MRLTACPPDSLTDLWPAVRPHLQAAAEHSLGEITADDVLVRAQQGTMFVYLAVADDGRIAGALVCEFVRYPQKASLNIALLAGRGTVPAVRDGGIELLRDLALAGGATYLECRSRASVARLLQRAFGATPQYTVSILEV